MTGRYITCGLGTRSPTGLRVLVRDPHDLAGVLEAHTGSGKPDAWFSAHCWAANSTPHGHGDKEITHGPDYRCGASWESSIAAVLDIDTLTGNPPDEDDHVRLAGALMASPGAGFYMTPKGARVLAWYSAPVRDRELAIAAERGLAVLIGKLLVREGLDGIFAVDGACVGDVARLSYAPKAMAKGIQRDADVYMPGVAHDPRALARHAPVDAPRSVPAPAALTGSVSAYAEAAIRREADRVMNASKGERNSTLNAASFAVGTLVGAGALNRELAIDWLVAAALAAGLKEHEARRTVASGLGSGVRQPRDLRGAA